MDSTILLVPALLALLSDAVSHPSCWVLLAIRVVVICWWKSFVCVYSATREDDTTFIFSHFGLFLSDAASNSHK